MASSRAISFDYPMRRSTNHLDDDVPPNGDANKDGASATAAAIAVSRLPVLEHYRKSTSTALALALIVSIANLFALIALTYYFIVSCTTQYGVLPNDFSAVDTPPSLTALEDQAGVTIESTSLIYYQANATFTQISGTYWEPFEVTCGCQDECILASCVGTIPITVKYEQCHPWDEAFSLATALVVYVNVAFTIVLVAVLAALPCTRESHAPLKIWDFVKMLFDG